MYKGYEAVIGLEVHVELKTKTKVFCSCPTDFGAEPNTQCCPVCMGMPGTLPVLNSRAVDFTVMAGLALGCKISEKSWFDRKNYFYPDLPKGFQITQAEAPFCRGGEVKINVSGADKRVRLKQIHLEEDAGKLIHSPEGTLIDYNRCGVPLIEIVSEPDMTSSDEAKAYLNELRRIMLFMGISDCKMNEGSLRCDVNISLHKLGEENGVRCEIKNLNSVSFVGKAIDYEIKRQAELLDSGGIVVKETRRFNEERGITEPMRGKENAEDYRYFTEPNIPPIVLSEEYIKTVKSQMPIMPDEAKNRLVNELKIAENTAEIITQTPKVYEYCLSAASCTKYPVHAANLIVGEVLPVCGEAPEEYICAEMLAETADMFGGGRITSNVAKQLIKLCSQSGDSPTAIAERDGLYQIRDRELLSKLAAESIAANEKALADYRRGKESAKKVFLGYIMKATGGRADAKLCAELIDKALN